MRAVLASALSLSLLAGCFPTNPQYRTYAKLGEGAAIVGGIAMLYGVNSGADCMNGPAGPDTSCKDKASVLGDVGLGLILVGLIGFIATVSTATDDQPTVTVVSKPAAPPAPVVAPPAAPAPAAPPAAPAPVTPTPTEPPPAPAGAGSAS